ncbi:MAG TPA: hypothetical protein VN622_03645 [Clostridia bacterium]|nr:hypothetical protein [Clostridia bacterium]
MSYRASRAPACTRPVRSSIIGRQLDLLCYVPTASTPGPRRNAIIERIEALNVAFARNL